MLSVSIPAQFTDMDHESIPLLEMLRTLPEQGDAGKKTYDVAEAGNDVNSADVTVTSSEGDGKIDAGEESRCLDAVILEALLKRE